ncbi:MAG: beta strand repeat-containing protein [Gammaproteobacteria bacterium]
MAVWALSSTAWGLPAGEKVTTGAGTVSQSGANLTVNQTSDRLSINWDSFNIGAGEAVRFNQPGAGSIVLNRVLGQDPSSILGTLSANGQVFLLNPNGVLFGAQSQVNVGGLVASSLQLSDQDFLAGRYSFAGNGSNGHVMNGGRLDAADGGYIALIAPQVSNEGMIRARNGTVALGAGDGVTLTFADHQLLSLTVNRGTVNALASNKQLIQADGGHVILSAKGRDAVFSGAVNNEGVIQARTVANQHGVITLLGDAGNDTVQIAGALDASAPDGGDGGFIETSATHVQIAPNTRITTAAPRGKTGQWLIDPTDYSIAASGGDITGAALASQLNTSNVTIQTSSAGAGNGDILLGDAVSWNSANSLTLSAHRNVNVNAAITNAGTGGVTLRADSQGACVAGAASCGTVLFGAGGGISVNGGAVRFDYNPAGSNAASPSYTTPTNYAGKVTLAGGSKLTTRMLVNDVTQLQAMTSNLSGDYALGRDVDATTTSTWNAGAGFLPIGNSSVNFTGSLDGNSHVISGLFINRPTRSGVGLFGVANSNASGLSNIGLNGGTIVGNATVGALVGQNSGGPINNDYASSTVTGKFWIVGGLIGYTTGSAIVNSHASGTTSGTFFVGGLAGLNQGSSVTNSYATGDVNDTGNNAGGLVGYSSGVSYSNVYATGAVSGTYSTGGLVGYNTSSPISNAYATGSVNGMDGVGGLVGFNNSGNITNAYSSGYVYGTSGVGGLVGAQAGSTIGNCYWDTQTSGLATSAGGTGLTTAQMMQAANFSGWNFTNTWGIKSAVSYPYLSVLNPAGVQVISGTVTGAVAGAPISIAADGSLLARAAAGSNGFYYAMLPANAFTANNTLLAWLSGTPAVDGAVVATGTNSDVTQANINTGVLSLRMTGSVTNSTLATAKGGLSDVHIPYSVNGANLTFGNSTVNQLLFFGSSANYNLTDSGGSINTVAALSGTLSYTQPGSFSVGTVAGLPGITGNINASITLATTNPGANLTLDQSVGAGGSVALSASGNFINNAGSAAIDAGSGPSGGRWLVYSKNPATDLFGGLLSGNTPLWSKTYAGYGPGAVVEAGNRYLFSYTPTLTVTPDNASKVYGTVANLAAAITGLVNAGSYGNVFTQETFSGMPALASPGAAATAAVSGSPYTITAAQGTLSAPGYAINFNGGALNITPAALNVTGNKASKTYDGRAYHGGDGVTYSGFVNGETASVLGGVLGYSGTAQGATSAGSYVLTPNGLTADNYTISFSDGTLTVNKALLALRADDKFRFSGDANPPLTFSASGFANGQTIGDLNGSPLLSTLATPFSSVGDYPITISGLSSPNYLINYVNGTVTVASQEIRQAAILGSMGDANNPKPLSANRRPASVTATTTIDASAGHAAMTTHLQVEKPGIRIPAGISASQ